MINRRAAFTATIAALALSACAMTELRKEGATSDQAQRDRLECEYEAEKATTAIRNSFERGWERADIRDRCLEVRGYRRVPAK